MRNLLYKKPVLATLSGALAAVTILIADCIHWPSVVGLLQSGTEFIFSDPQNGVVLPDGKWFWPSKGVGPECNSCLASIIKANEPWKAKKNPTEHMLRCVYKADCKHSWDGTKLKHVSFEPSLAKTNPRVSDEAKERESDWRQFELNWKKAQLFASYFGAPGSKPGKLEVLTEWVPPVDPTGSPAPDPHIPPSHPIGQQHTSILMQRAVKYCKCEQIYTNAQVDRSHPGYHSLRWTARAASPPPPSPQRQREARHPTVSCR
jgi:hypothetical protein